MPLLKDLKECAERATGLRHPSERGASALARKDYAQYHFRTREVLGIAFGKGRVRFGGNKGRIFILNARDVAVPAPDPGHQCLSADDNFLFVGAYPPAGTYEECTTLQERPRAQKSTPKISLPRKDPIYGAGGPLPKLWKKSK